MSKMHIYHGPKAPKVTVGNSWVSDPLILFYEHPHIDFAQN